MAAEVPTPERVFAHGFLTMGGEKMSKTRGTGIDPKELLAHFGVDAYRYYLLRETQWGQDGSFSWESMVARYNADLANDLGNLASRVQAMLHQYFAGEVPEALPGAGPEEALAAKAEETVARYDDLVLRMDLTGAIASVWDLVGATNRYLVEVAPWALAKDESRRDDLARSLYASAEALRLIAILISPVMPGAAERLWSDLGVPAPLSEQRLPGSARWGGLAPGTAVRRGEALFPRLED
jgi:methionyl-tRNA synthetase